MVGKSFFPVITMFIGLLCSLKVCFAPYTPIISSTTQKVSSFLLENCFLKNLIYLGNLVYLEVKYKIEKIPTRAYRSNLTDEK